jgi:tripartite-type tricarboxylate transporter receptor subunit TctC
MQIRTWARRVAAAFALAVPLAAGAQAFPHKPITLVVPFAAGGPTDTIARIIAERMGRGLGQPVVVENTAGAGGSIAVTRVARSPADGYTLFIGHNGPMVIVPAMQSLQVDVLADLDPVAMVATNPQVIVSNPGVPAKDLKELVAWAKKEGDKVAAGTGGPGTPAHISVVYFGKTIGAPVQPIHYKGSGPAMQDVIAGHIQMGFEQAANALPHIRAGKIRGYAVTAKTRLASAPEIPTVDEAGLPGFYMAIWHAFWVPKGTPREAVGRLNGAIREALADPAVRKKLEDLGQEIPAPDQQTPEALRAFHKAEADKWWPIIKQAGIKAD